MVLQVLNTVHLGSKNSTLKFDRESEGKPSQPCFGKRTKVAIRVIEDVVGSMNRPNLEFGDALADISIQSSPFHPNDPAEEVQTLGRLESMAM